MEKYFEQTVRRALRSSSRNNHLVYPALAMAPISQISNAGRQERRALLRSLSLASLLVAIGLVHDLL